MAGRRTQVDLRELSEEQGWVARMVHLFKSDNLATQFEVGAALLFWRCAEAW